jgi:anti-sigma factor RsiW
MTVCGDKELLLHGLLDGELDAANTLLCEAHLGECAGCAAEYERLQALRNRIRTAGVRYEASAELRARVTAALGEAANQNRETPAGARAPHLAVVGGSRDERLTAREGSGRSPAAAPPPARLGSPGRSRPGKVHVSWALGGLAGALAAALAFVMLVRLPGQTIADELVASHVRSLLAAHLVDVVTSDRHVVKPWFAGKVAFAPPVVELAQQGFPLVGGRLDYLHGRVVASVVYRRRQHVINVFVWPVDPHEGPLAAPAQRDGYNVVGWKQGGLEFWAVSDVDPSELALLRAAFMAQAGE